MQLFLCNVNFLKKFRVHGESLGDILPCGSYSVGAVVVAEKMRYRSYVGFYGLKGILPQFLPKVTTEFLPEFEAEIVPVKGTWNLGCHHGRLHYKSAGAAHRVYKAAS